MIFRLVLPSVVVLFLAISLCAQDAQTTEQQQAALQEKAVQLLDQVVAEARSLKLPENRLRVLWQAGDLVWTRDETRARALFSQTASGLSELMQSLDVNDRRYTEYLQAPLQLRQEFLTTVARRDPKLAYELLLTTRPSLPPNAATSTGQQNAEANLEMTLLAQMASSDPRLALQNAEAALDKGQFPNSLGRLLAQLQEKDKDAAAKLKDKLLKRLRAESLLSNSSASNLSLSLLRPGPRVSETKTAPQTNLNNSNRTNQALDEVAYRELLELVIAAALNAVPRVPSQVPNAPIASSANSTSAFRSGQANAQALQNNARNLINGLQSVLPQIDKYLPARAPAVRQKFAEMGLRSNPIVMTPELNNLMQNGSAEAVLQAASTASTPEMQTMLYRQRLIERSTRGSWIVLVRLLRGTWMKSNGKACCAK